jgi:alpha-tubulin suppressor-like RCC1 family protein
MRLRPEWLALALAVLSCSDSDAQAGCTPTPSCSLRADRLGPAPEMDAGPPGCRDQGESCQADLISAGGAHTCAVATGGELFCFGDDTDGQLGLHEMLGGAGGAQDAGIIPGGFSAIGEAVLQVAAGGAHTCALTETQRVVCFGRNLDGQVDGEPSATRAPIVVAALGAVQVAAGGAHSCAVTGDGVVCWGRALYAETGHGASDQAQPPALVPGTEDAREVATGARHTCMRRADGRLLCWGELVDEASGQPQIVEAPTLVPGVEDAVSISAGAGHTCLLHRDLRLSCFGRNESGQLGDGTRIARARPVDVAIETALEVSAGGLERDGELLAHTCALTRGFHVSCWGRNAEGQLGIGHASDSLSPAVVLPEPDRGDEPYLADVKATVAGGLHTCGIEDDGETFCFGDDALGQRALPEGDEAVFGRAQETYQFGGDPRFRD